MKSFNKIGIFRSRKSKLRDAVGWAEQRSNSRNRKTVSGDQKINKNSWKASKSTFFPKKSKKKNA